MTLFDLDRFKADCSAVVSEPAAVQAIREPVARAVADPRAVQKAITEPRLAEIQILHRSADLTILNVVWGPRMTVMPHNHEMCAVIGIYSGREDNILWRRTGRREEPNRGRWRQGLERTRRLSPGPRHHPFGHQSDREIDRSDSRLWRRLLRCAAQRVGSGATDRAAIRRTEGAAAI